MSKVKILVTSPYKEFTTLVKEISAEQKLEVRIVEGVLEDVVQKVQQKLATNDIEVILSRGGTAAALKNAVDIPIVTAEFSDFDLLQALWQAVKYSNKIAYLGYSHREGYLFGEELEEILGTKVSQYLYTDSISLKRVVQRASEDNVDVVVGGGEWGLELARNYGMKGILIYSSRRTVYHALERAKEIVIMRRTDREYSEIIDTCFGSVKEGLIFIDKYNKISLVNDFAEKLTGIKQQEVKGKTIEEFPDNNNFRQVIESNEPVIRKINGEKIIVNHNEVSHKSEHFGVVITLQPVSKVQNLEQKIRQELYAKGLVAKFSFNDFITKSKIMQATLEKARNFASVDSTVLIQGESGTGKELMTQSIHNASKRNHGPFVAVNCAAIPENLLESELFGYEEGAFTGARKGGKIGFFELAHSGTIFLDEISSMPHGLQSRLLRVLQEKEVMRVGGDRVIPVDVRVIAATNENLLNLVTNGDFRKDLYFRINVLNLRIPPLHARPDDIEPLLNHFIKVFNHKFNKNMLNMPNKLLKWFLNYNWPGNVRELENYCQKLVILSNGQEFENDWVDQLIAESENDITNWQEDKDYIYVKMGSLKEMENDLIKKVHQKLLGNCSNSADYLEISRTTLWKKLRQISN